MGISMRRNFALIAFALLAAQATSLVAQSRTPYFPPRGTWERKAPAEVGMDAQKLKEAVDYALTRASTWDFEADQARTFGTPLGPVPKTRAGTNGIIVRHGYIVAEFGDIKANDPVYSVAKSFLSTVAAIAVDRGLIKSTNDPVASYVNDGGYDSPHNAKITWLNHLQQSSEWEGVMWGKNANFIGAEAFGRGER
ncbi:MAG: serine hydrolase domain-containing protein, partial [Longimicrobiales bacterium]